MNQEEIVRLTCEKFSVPAEAIKFSPILKGGSERSFWRCTVPRLGPCVVMSYSEERQENGFYADIAVFLKEIGVSVPEIHAHDASLRLAWVEDLGERDLHALRQSPWTVRREAYFATLQQAATLHDCDVHSPKARALRVMPGFDEMLYAWERNYFFERFVHGYCGMELSAEAKTHLDFELEALAARLCGMTPVFVHRDFQSQNVILKDAGAWLIDFQGMRHGSRFYDLGSLLYDPYVSFSDAERLECLGHYYTLGGTEGLSWQEFQNDFHLAAAQRLMQALGAYGFLGLVKGKKEFLGYIPAGLHNLREAAAKSGRLPHLRDLAEQISERVDSGQLPHAGHVAQA